MGSRHSSVPEHLHHAQRTATPPRPSATSPSKTSTAGSTIPWTPAKGELSRALRRAADESETADPRRSSHGAAPTEGKTAVFKIHSGTTSSTMALPAGTPQHTPSISTRLDPGIPRPPAAGAAAGGRGIRRIAGGGLLCAGSLRKSPSLYCRWGKGAAKVRLCPKCLHVFDRQHISLIL